MDTERRRNRDYHRLLGDKSDPNKITIKIERQIWKHVRHDDEGRRSWHVESVTVRSGRCRLAGCNAAARSGMVEYDHLLPHNRPRCSATMRAITSGPLAAAPCVISFTDLVG